MHRALLIALTLAATPAANPALADGHLTTSTPDPKLADPPTGWLGDTPHFVMMGTVGAHSFNIQAEDISNLANVTSFKAKRDYLETDLGFAYTDFEITLEARLNGIEKQIELEFENADFTTHTLPALFLLTSEDNPEGAFTNMELEFEWKTDAASVDEEIEGWTGALSLAVDRGTPDDKGLLPDGLIGGFVSAAKDGQELTISFTVPVTDYDIDD